ncbi:phosphate-starvation-inducible PsiE family protein [Halolamina pelagica]|uniref:phosphate-starvation-inducible PsiE family protein n=1 Tax=Halolamina pelagica TaxID=699431 RepID=UPI0019559564|nr:phosphate-starvation-inducible PsiE family protein [Halolamina pelagica]
MLERTGKRTDVLMDILELATAVIMIILFAIGVYDLGLKLVTLITSGEYTNPNAVLKIIDTALLLLIIVEIYRTVIAYVEDLNILPIVLNVALIAMSRKIISFRTGKYATKDDAIMAALAYGLLMVILIAAFYVIHHIQAETEFNIYAAGEEDEEVTG